MDWISETIVMGGLVLLLVFWGRLADWARGRGRPKKKAPVARGNCPHCGRPLVDRDMEPKEVKHVN